MTYLSAKDWCENNVSQSMFDDFDDWLEACKNEFDNAFELFSNSDFISLMRDSWDEFSEEREEEIEERRDIEEAIRRKVEEELLAKKEAPPIPEKPPERIPEKPPSPPEPIVIEVEQPRVIPATGRAPILTQQRFTFKEPSRVRAFIRRVFRI